MQSEPEPSLRIIRDTGRERGFLRIGEVKGKLFCLQTSFKTPGKSRVVKDAATLRRVELTDCTRKVLIPSEPQDPAELGARLAPFPLHAPKDFHLYLGLSELLFES